MKALFIVPFGRDVSPGQRYRFEQWLSLLPPDALQVEIRPLLSATAYHRIYRPGAVASKAIRVAAGLSKRLFDVVRSGRWDVVFVYREAFFLGPPLLELLLDRRYPIVYDFDDAIFLGDTSEANAIVARWKCPSKVATVVEHAAVTTVGNEWLASFARQHSRSVAVIPTTVDVEKYTPLRRERCQPIRVGWSGSRTTAIHLHSIDEALRRIARELPVELVAIGDPDFKLEGADRLQALPWRSDSELDLLRSLDVGIMPLPDDEWSKGKCGLKALLYMALAIPTVVSPVGVNTTIVSNREDGVLATTTDEWFDAIAQLVDDEDLARRLGEAGRETVVKRYSGRLWARRFLEVLEQAASSRP
jgi:glycosyltransferase involved in cell wall biosynthesis